MGAGKTTLARALVERTGLGYTDIDSSVERMTNATIADLFAAGEAEFREHEQRVVRSTLLNGQRLIVDLGGGAVTSSAVRDALRERAVTVWLDEDVDTCWERARGSDRPLAQDEAEFRRLYEERRSLYAEVADVIARDVDDAVLAAAGVHVERGALQRLGELDVAGRARLRPPRGAPPRAAVPARGRSPRPHPNPASG